MTEESRAKLGRWALVALGVAALALVVAGSSTVASHHTSQSETGNAVPGKVERLEGTNVNRVILTAAAVKRLGIVTEPVSEAPMAGAVRRVVPYAAVLYDPSGGTWAYTNPEPLVFVRQPIMVDYIQANQAVLKDGPGTGTSVVTVGASELYGTEFGVSGDE